MYVYIPICVASPSDLLNNAVSLIMFVNYFVVLLVKNINTLCKMAHLNKNCICTMLFTCTALIFLILWWFKQNMHQRD